MTWAPHGVTSRLSTDHVSYLPNQPFLFYNPIKLIYCVFTNELFALLPKPAVDFGRSKEQLAAKIKARRGEIIA